MNKICAKIIPAYSLFSLFLQVPAFLAVFFLIAVINIEVGKTNTSFLAFSSFFEDTYKSNSFFFTEKVFNIREVFFFFFSNNVDTCCRKILALVLSLSIIVVKISLVVLVFYVVLIN